MSIVVDHCPENAAAAAGIVSPASRTDAVLRDGFYLSCEGRSLFTWLHHQSAVGSRNHGVVICPPIGFEQLHAHRGLRHLADEIARSGMPTLRFDWHGTGDATGDDADPDRCSVWQSNVRTAIRWMKYEFGCASVSVVGLRLGAMLAALATGDEEIENLVLWAPVTNGRGFVREMTVVDMMSEAPRERTSSTGLIDAAGFRIFPETAAALTNCSLLQSKPSCRRVLLASRFDAPPNQRLVEHFTGYGIAVEEKILPGVTEMLVEPHRSQVPDIAIQQISAWLSQHAFIQDQADSEQHCHPDQSAGGMPDQIEVVASDAMIRESAWRIGQSPDLFGILSEPVLALSADLPTIVLLNAGAAYRIGPGRMNVEMARQFSAQGFRCLRLDLCGLGDSVTQDPAAENDSYAATAFRDIEAALSALRERLGPQKFVLMGLCSGAYAAFQSAVQFTDSDLVESVLINPLTYYWREGMSIDDAPTSDLIREHYYLTSALQPDKWLKLLSGRSHIGIRGALRIAARRLGLAKRSRPQAAVNSCGPAVSTSSSTACPSHPETENLTNDLKRVMAAGRHLSMFFSTSDPGYSILTSKAGRQTKRMLQRGRLSLKFLDESDHTFSRHAARQKLMDALSDHLRQRYPSA